MEIEYSKISLYLELFDLLREIGVLPEYQNISIIVNDDYTCLLYFNANEIISYKKLKRILFKKKFVTKLMPDRYNHDVFNQLEYLLQTGIENKYSLIEDGINYNNNQLITSESEKYKLSRVFYISYETPISENINKINLIHFTTLIDEFQIDLDRLSSNTIDVIKNSYSTNTQILKEHINAYNKCIKRIKSIRKKIKKK